MASYKNALITMDDQGNPAELHHLVSQTCFPRWSWVVIRIHIIFYPEIWKISGFPHHVCCVSAVRLDFEWDLIFQALWSVAFLFETYRQNLACWSHQAIFSIFSEIPPCFNKHHVALSLSSLFSRQQKSFVQVLCYWHISLVTLQILCCHPFRGSVCWARTGLFWSIYHYGCRDSRGGDHYYSGLYELAGRPCQAETRRGLPLAVWHSPSWCAASFSLGLDCKYSFCKPAGKH